jgi:hypothetical protein
MLSGDALPLATAEARNSISFQSVTSFACASMLPPTMMTTPTEPRKSLFIIGLLL